MNPTQVQDWAVRMFTDIGGGDWLNKLILGGMVMIGLLLFIVVLLIMFLAFSKSR